jgi:hypothetical protein
METTGGRSVTLRSGPHFPALVDSEEGDLFIHELSGYMYLFCKKGWEKIMSKADFEAISPAKSREFVRQQIEQVQKKERKPVEVLHRPPQKQRLKDLMKKKQLESEW